MKIDLAQFRQTFLNESTEHIQTIESGLLELRSSPGDQALLNSIFRSAHSIKGGGGSFGMENLVRFTHALESLLDKLRGLELAVTDEIVAALIDSVDILRALLEADAESPMPVEGTALIERLERLAQTKAGDAAARTGAGSAGASKDEESSAHEPLAFYRIEFRPDQEIFSSGTNPIVLLRNLADLGRVSTIELHTDRLPSLQDLDPTRCYLGWTIEMATHRPEQELREVFEFVEHLAEVTFRRMEESGPALQSRPTAEEARTAGSMTACAAAGSGVPAPRKVASSKPAAGEATSIRVSTEKIDRLIDLVGELVIAHVMTAQMVERFSPGCLSKLRESVAAMERNTRELHERAMAIRMLPVGTLFQRSVRTVYDIAQATGKEIELVTAGEETEIDKGMLELLGDPLTHIIRNSADHGIEPPAERVARGKPAKGVIRLRALHRSGRLVIEVSDDGAGIDPARVRDKAIRQGLIAADAQLTDEQIRLLIFEPGFSTRDEVSDLSGRGVGMDVVRQNVQQMNGTVTLRSELGQGTTLTIELPLTLAILEGLLVGVGGRTLVIPLLAVVETVSPRPSQMQRIAEKGEVVVLREEAIPLLQLHRFLGLERERAIESCDDCPRSLVVVVEAGRKKIGLVVDELLGQQQVVVKSLEKHLRKVDGLMGATILGDGCVAPILDVSGIAALRLFSVDAIRGHSPETLGAAGHTPHVSLSSREGRESANAMV